MTASDEDWTSAASIETSRSTCLRFVMSVTIPTEPRTFPSSSSSGLASISTWISVPSSRARRASRSSATPRRRRSAAAWADAAASPSRNS
jgi:hypothetical protein